MKYTWKKVDIVQRNLQIIGVHYFDRKIARAMLTVQPLLCVHYFFKGLMRSKETWMCPYSQRRHHFRLDHAIFRRHQPSSLKQCRSLHSADCRSDHVRVRFKLQMFKIRQTRSIKLVRSPCSCGCYVYAHLSLQSILPKAVNVFCTRRCIPATWSERYAVNDRDTVEHYWSLRSSLKSEALLVPW